MPSEDEVRAGVHRIADRVEVDAQQHLAAVLDRGRAPSRRRPVAALAAAASVAAVLATGIVLTRVLPSNEAPDERPVPMVVDGTPDGTVPSVFGHTRESAVDLLESRDLTVRLGEQDSCTPEGRPVATAPATGTPVEPGDTVTLLISFQGPLTDCAADYSEPWAFVDFATGRGPAPAFADEVTVFVDGRRAGDLAEVSSILDRATREVQRRGDNYVTPYLGAIDGTPPDTWCGVSRPDEVGDREALTITIDFEESVPEPACPVRVALYKTGDRIDAVVAWSARAQGSARQPIPDVVGLSLDEARDQVTAAGYPARVEELETCDPREGVVVEQAPRPQDIEDDAADEPGPYDGPVTLVVEVPHLTRDCAGLAAAADAFLAFARGGPPPPWAPEVQQLLGYAEWDSVTAARADDRDAWSLCSGVAPTDCQVSPLVVAGRDGEVATGEYSDSSRYPGDEVCELVDRGGLPDGLYEGQIVLYPATIDSCDDDWSVWLWIDDEGRIKAVNLLVPR